MAFNIASQYIVGLTCRDSSLLFTGTTQLLDPTTIFNSCLIGLESLMRVIHIYHEWTMPDHPLNTAAHRLTCQNIHLCWPQKWLFKKMYSDCCINVIMLHSAHTELSSGEGFCCGGTQAIIHSQIRQYVRVCLSVFTVQIVFLKLFVDSYNKENDMQFATVYYHLLLWTDCFALLYKQVYSDVEPAAWSTLLLEPYVKEQCSSTSGSWNTLDTQDSTCDTLPILPLQQYCHNYCHIFCSYCLYFCSDVMRCLIIAEEVKLTLKLEGKVLACQSFMSTLLSPSHQVNVFGNVTELLHELTIAIWVGPWISTTVWWFKYTVYYKYLFGVLVAQAPAQRCLFCAWNNNKVRMTHLFFCVHWWKLYFQRLFLVLFRFFSKNIPS